MSDIPQWLISLGIPASCISRASSASEKGRSFVIHTQKRDEVWRIKVDDCWMTDKTIKKVDYLFWVQSSSGRKLILLVELKGHHFKKALQQIESMLEMLCKKGEGFGIHKGLHKQSPGHNAITARGVRAYVILSSGRGIPKKLYARERIRQKYNVLVHPKTKRLEVTGVDKLP